MMKFLYASLCVVAVCFNAFSAVEGISVSVSYRTPNDDLSRDQRAVVCPEWGVPVIRRNVGKLVRYNFKDTQVLSHDTLTGEWLVGSPTINLEGTKIAMFRYPVRLLPGGKQVETEPEMKCDIVVMSIDGGEQTDLADVACDWDGGYLDWPHGDWLYWVDIGHEERTKGLKVWKLNVNTKEKVEVCDYFQVAPMDGVNPPDEESAFIHRWNLNADANWAMVRRQPYNRPEWWGGNYAHCFPPVNNDPRAPGCGPEYTYDKRDINGIRGCNPAISPTGNYVSHYDGASHSHFYIKRWDHTVNELQHMDLGGGPRGGIHVPDEVRVWAGQPNTPINGGEYQGFAANSDKWHLMQISQYGGKAKAVEEGSEQVATNWVDKIALIPANNPDQQPIDNLYYGSTTGDMWIKPPAGKEGMVEDVMGEWHPVEDGKKLSDQAANPWFTMERQVCEFPGYDEKGNVLPCGQPGVKTIRGLQSAVIDNSAPAGVYSIQGRRLRGEREMPVSSTRGVAIIRRGNRAFLHLRAD